MQGAPREDGAVREGQRAARRPLPGAVHAVAFSQDEPGIVRQLELETAAQHQCHLLATGRLAMRRRIAA